MWVIPQTMPWHKAFKFSTLSEREMACEKGNKEHIMIKNTPFGDGRKTRGQKCWAERGRTKKRGLLSTEHVSEGIIREWCLEVRGEQQWETRMEERVMDKTGVLYQLSCTYNTKCSTGGMKVYALCIRKTKNIFCECLLFSFSVLLYFC